MAFAALVRLKRKVSGRAACHLALFSDSQADVLSAKMLALAQGDPSGQTQENWTRPFSPLSTIWLQIGK